ncbi:P33 [Serratia entomophila]|uniref:RecT family recombinase n=1 Tax=Serratia entomophila TaxID=42906 RepID=UPI00217A4B0A|nr:RecT family recombinase [Serratia entomophila]CAI1787357.1 P33 [Serratia entomophila]
MDLVQFVDQQESLFLPAVSDPGIKWEREKQFAIQALQKNETLGKTARANPISTQNAIINVAAIGISLSPASKLAYLVPRDGAVCLDISYMGLMHIAQQSGSVQWCQALVVRKNDKFKRTAIDRAPLHEFSDFSTEEERGEIVGAYCVAKTAEGDYLTHTMPIAKIFGIRDRSSGWKAYVAKRIKSTPWATDEEQMILKTVVKQAVKYWPRRDRLDAAINYVNTEAGEGINFSESHKVEKDVTGITQGQSDRINSILTSVDSTFDSLKKACLSMTGRHVESQADLTSAEADKLISSLERKLAAKETANAA